MSTHYYIHADIEKKLDEYRQAIKLRTGKLPTKQTVITDLLRTALDNQPVVPPVGDVMSRLDDLEERVKEIEDAAKYKEDVKRLKRQEE